MGQPSSGSGRESEWQSTGAQSYTGYQSDYQPAGPASGPAVDIVDNENDLWVFIDLPGFTEEEISVRGDENTLVLTADRPADVEEGRRVLCKERSTHIERNIPLPFPVRPSGSRAVYEDGVCKVILPKAATDRYSEIEFTD